MKFLGTSTKAGNQTTCDGVEDPRILSAQLLNTKKSFRLKAYTHVRISEIGTFCPREYAIGYQLGSKKESYVEFAMQQQFDLGSALHWWYQNKSKVFKEVLHGWWKCYDDETEVLTYNGFKLFKDITFDDKIATLNPKTDFLEYHHPIAKQVFWYEGEMFHTGKSRNVSLCVTPDHNMYVRKTPRDKKTKFDFCKISELEHLYGFQFKKDCLWKGELFTPHLPGVGEATLEDYLEFMAMWLSDGYIVKYITKTGNNRCRVAICGQKERKRKKTKILFDKFFKRYYNTNKEYATYNKELYNFLEIFKKTKNKYIPQNIKDLPPKHLRLFLHHYILADGTISDRDLCSIYTVSDQLRDDLQEIIQKAGWSSSVYEDNRKQTYCRQIDRMIKGNGPVYHIVIIKKKLRPYFGPRYDVSLEKKEYSGFVYDLTVPNHTMLIRRRGKLVWSGNCKACQQTRKDKNGVFYFGTRPTTKCNNCGAHHEASEYQEFFFRIDTPYRIVGKIDGVIKKDNVYRFCDLKSFWKKPDSGFPAGNDVTQISSYAHFYNFVPEEHKFPVPIDTSTVYLHYISKKFSYSDSLPTYQIRPTKKMIDLIEKRVKDFTDSANTGVLPEPFEQCVRGKFETGKAKECFLKPNCLHYYQGGR